MRHLAAVAKPVHFLDRRAQPFVPVYVELVTAPTSDRPGYGLSGNVAVFYSVLLYLAGTPADGRRQSRGEVEHKDSFVRRTPSAGKLSKDYGWTYDQIDAWSKACALPRRCPHCARAHALLRIDRRNGHKNTYVLLRCQDLRDDECVAPALVERVKRTPTGAADPNTRSLRDDPRLGLPGFDQFVSTTGSRPENERPTLGQSPTVASQSAINSDSSGTALLAQTLGQSPRVLLCDVSDRPQVEAAVTGRIRVLEGFAMIERVAVPADAIEVIARAIEEPAELYNSLISVVAAASIEGCAITSAFVSGILSQRQASVIANSALEDSNVVAAPSTAAHWATHRILELALRSEKGTTLARARAYYNEFSNNCLAHAAGDRIKAESELARVLTDPRCCGAVGKDPPLKPIAMIRAGFRDGWIWIEAALDDGSEQLARAFERDLSRDRQAEVERIFRAFTAGAALDYARLREHRVSSKAMIAYLHRRFNTLLTTENAAKPPE